MILVEDVLEITCSLRDVGSINLWNLIINNSVKYLIKFSHCSILLGGSTHFTNFIVQLRKVVCSSKIINKFRSKISTIRAIEMKLQETVIIDGTSLWWMKILLVKLVKIRSSGLLQFCMLLYSFRWSKLHHSQQLETFADNRFGVVGKHLPEDSSELLTNDEMFIFNRLMR